MSKKAAAKKKATKRTKARKPKAPVDPTFERKEGYQYIVEMYPANAEASPFRLQLGEEVLTAGTATIDDFVNAAKSSRKAQAQQKPEYALLKEQTPADGYGADVGGRVYGHPDHVEPGTTDLVTTSNVMGYFAEKDAAVEIEAQIASVQGSKRFTNEENRAARVKALQAQAEEARESAPKLMMLGIIISTKLRGGYEAMPEQLEQMAEPAYGVEP